MPEDGDPDGLPRPEITLSGSTATYRGVLEVEYAKDFLDRIAKHGTAIKTLVIESGGGDTRAGMDIGEWVHEHGVTVVVDWICFSSCANYIFTAAPAKTIRADAFVGWHGSEQQNRFFDEEFADANPDNLPGACRERPLGVAEDPNSQVFEGYARELRFLERDRAPGRLPWSGPWPSPHAAAPTCGWMLRAGRSTSRAWSVSASRTCRTRDRGDYPSQAAVELGGVAVYEVGESDLE